MSILPLRSPQCFRIFQRSMIHANQLLLCDVLDSSLFAEAFQEDKVVFGIADEDVFTPAITLWAMVSQFLFSGKGRSCKATASREIRRMSFTETYQLLSTDWLLCACVVVSEAVVVSAQLQGMCAIIGE